MSEMYVDVDTAITVPVNVFPLTDDTDFKTRETGIVYNQAGMDLVWNFQTTAGVTTQTAVTPTTSGDYDWTHSGDAMYKIEIPASGGASINNDSEGTGWFTGFATGVLPWRGPMILFRAAGINNVLIDSAYSATRGLSGTALPDAVADAAGGVVISDAGGLDIDALDTSVAAIEVDTNSLNDTKIPNTLNTTASGNIGIDWGNVENKTTANDLSGTDIQLVDTVTTYTGNTPQTGDSYARLGAPAGASVSADNAAIKVDTAEIGVAGAGLTNINLPNQTMDITGSLTGSVGSVSGSVGSVVGHTPQTGDNFARIGAPAGASVSADIASVQTDTTAIETDTQDIQSRLPAALVSGKMDSDTTAISGDTTAADNLESTYDGSGYVDDKAPATQEQLGSLSVGSAAIAIQSQGYTLTTGTQSSGTYTDTATVDEVEHQHTDSAGAMELYYEFNVGGSGVATDVMVTGRINGSNDSLDGIYAYDWDGAGWDRLGAFTGQASSVNQVRDYALLLRHTGTGANNGLVRVRFYAASGLTSATLYIDQIITEYSVVSQSVGYANGSIWIDTNASNTNTEDYVDGTADNPVSTWAAALTLSSSLGIKRFQMINGSSITLTGNSDGYSFLGSRWDLALGGQSISSGFILGACVTGVCTGSTPPHFEHCEIGTATFPPCRINGGSGFTGTLTLGSAGDFDFIDCSSLFSGAGTPTVDLGSGVGSSDLHIRGWKGGLTFSNILSGDAISMEGTGGVITVGGTGGSINIRGIFESVVDSSSAAVSITETATINRKAIVSYQDGAVWVDTNGSNTGALPYVDGTADNPVNSLANAIIIVGLVSLKKIHQLKGSSITLGQTFTRYIFDGDGGVLALGGQQVDFCTFVGQTISGVQTGTGRNFYSNCRINGATLTDGALRTCSLNSTITLSDTGDYSMLDCYSTTDSSEPVFDFTAVGNTELLLREWNGPLTLDNLSSGDVVSIDGNSNGITLTANCTGGTVNLVGNVVIASDSSSGVTITQSGNNVELIGDVQTDTTAILDDTSEIGTAGAGLTDLGGMSTAMKAEVNAEVVDTLITDTYAEPGSVPSATSSIKDKLNWVFTLARNKLLQTGTTGTLRNDADSGDIATKTDSDNGTTATRGEWS